MYALGQFTLRRYVRYLGYLQYLLTNFLNIGRLRHV